MTREEIFLRIDALNEEFIRIWEKVCNIESPTKHKPGVDAVGDCFIQLAQTRGFLCKKVPMEISGDPVSIVMNPTAKGKPICLSAHMDTVQELGSCGTPAVHFAGDFIYGPGVSDCKGGAVAALCAMFALDDCRFRDRPIKLILQSDEENSSRNSKKATVDFMAKEAEGCLGFLNCEGYTPDTVCLIRKGIATCTLQITGVPVHAKDCAIGVNAIAEAACKILELEKMKDTEGITCNCGIIKGGLVTNLVPGSCELNLEIRYADNEQYEKADTEVRRIAATSYLAGTSCTVTQNSRRLAMPLCDRNLVLLEKCNRIFEENGFPVLSVRRSFGGSDASDITARGIPCIDSVGVPGKKIHTVEEYAPIASLAQAAKRIALLAAFLRE